MHRIHSLVLIILLGFSNISIAVENINPGCESVGLGRVYTTLSNIWSVNGNIAGISTIDNISISSAYTHKFMLPQLSTRALAMAIPNPIFVFAASYQRFGFKSYNENMLTAAFARKFGNRFSVGLSFHTIMINLKSSNELRTQYMYNMSCGMMWNINSKLNFGTSLTHLIPYKTSNNVEHYFDPALAIGISYQMVEAVKCFLEMKNTYYGKNTISIGSEVTLSKFMQFQLGTHLGGGLNSNLFSFGLSACYNQLNINFAFEKHPYLGFSPFVELTLKLK